ncbi:MAG: hypothetical protein WKI04_19175 [Ferruginibacter sp.]
MGSAVAQVNVYHDLLLDSAGNAYLIGQRGGMTQITKKLADGTLDVSYGKAGTFLTIPVIDAQALMQEDGKLIIAGSTRNLYIFNNYLDFLVVRLNTNGSLDSSFDDDGFQITNFGMDDVVTSMTLQQDGKLLVAGYTTDYYLQYPYRVVARYTSDGTMDTDFNADRPNTAISEAYTFLTSVHSQTDGKIILGGPNNNNVFVISKLNINGDFDSSFQENGRLTTIFGWQPPSTIV